MLMISVKATLFGDIFLFFLQMVAVQLAFKLGHFRFQYEGCLCSAKIYTFDNRNWRSISDRGRLWIICREGNIISFSSVNADYVFQRLLERITENW